MITSSIWLPATLIAGALQAWRTAVQQRVRATLSVNAAGLVRYLFGLPVAWALLVLYEKLIAADTFPAIHPMLLLFALAAGIAQILATNLLIMAFGYRNFIAGTAYSKTEALQSAILALVLLGERLSPLSWLGISTGVAGVLVLSVGGQRIGPGGLLRVLGQPAAICGIAAGFLFAMTSVAVKRATFEVASDDKIEAALIVLAVTVFLQTLMQGAYLFWREREQFAKIAASWRVSGQVGLLASLGSACWFTGFATAPVALVRIVGQVEVLFTLGFSHFYLREKLARTEAAGLLLVAFGVILALAGTGLR
ncbi:EamA family transporter [Rhizorhapis sp. SPR117]|uniref:EamA family transporter n=1 Tax=Rhizorhapis sp. SPR117 TaxID=2912611 RepID=UPI001F3F8AB6|nr:DMT family transporter [Rhizorhapis sp. SPR117]